MRRPQRNHSAKFKAQVALAGLQGETTLAEQLDVHANQMTDWKSQLLKSAEEVFLTKAGGRELKSGAEYEGPAGRDRSTDDGE